jgi:hypothetical protein
MHTPRGRSRALCDAVNRHRKAPREKKILRRINALHILKDVLEGLAHDLRGVAVRVAHARRRRIRCGAVPTPPTRFARASARRFSVRGRSARVMCAPVFLARMRRENVGAARRDPHRGGPKKSATARAATRARRREKRAAPRAENTKIKTPNVR